jgi:hypothetical protein
LAEVIRPVSEGRFCTTPSTRSGCPATHIRSGRTCQHVSRRSCAPSAAAYRTRRSPASSGFPSARCRPTWSGSARSTPRRAGLSATPATTATGSGRTVSAGSDSAALRGRGRSRNRPPQYRLACSPAFP